MFSENFNYHFRNTSCNDGHVFMDFSYVPTAKKQHIGIDGNPFPRPTKKLKSWWNNPKPAEAIINGQTVKYYVHEYGLRKLSCRLEVVEGGEGVQSYITKTHHAASRSEALQKCLDDLNEKADRYAPTPEQIATIYSGYKSDHRLFDNDKDPRVEKEKPPEDNIADDFPGFEDDKKTKSHLNWPKRILRAPGKAAKRFGKDMIASGDSLAKYSRTLTSQHNEMVNLLRTSETEKISNFFNRNPQFANIQALSPQEQRAWMERRANILRQASHDAQTSADNHRTTGNIINNASKKYMNQIMNSGTMLSDQWGVNVGNYLFNVTFCQQEFSPGDLHNLGIDALATTAQSIGEDIISDVIVNVVKNVVGDTATQYVPGINQVRFVHTVFTELSDAKDMTECVTIGGKTTLRITTQYFGATIGQTLIPVPVLGAAAGVVLGRALENGILWVIV